MNQRVRKLIINADDFGFTPGVTAGILYAHQNGILTSTTAMVNTKYAEQSIKEAKEFPTLGIGLHFVLDIGQPISSCVSSLTDQSGSFLQGKKLIESAQKDDVKKELEAQLNQLYGWGVKVTHIDSHHHMHFHIPCALEATLEVAESYKLPVRSFSEVDFVNVLTSDYFIMDFYGKENISPDNLVKIFSGLEPGITEIMCHPAFIDPWLYKNSSYNMERMEELQTLVNNKVVRCTNSSSYELIHFGVLEG